MLQIRVITKLPNSEQSYKGKVKTHKYINRQNVTIFMHKIWITLASISYEYVSIVVYIRSVSDKGIGA
jgi:hypothetical protein